MNEIIALKTTVMTQQMKKQYDYLETTIQRFKTQLEKAILVSKMEAAGAASGAADGGGSGGASANRNIVLSGANDCRAQTASGSTGMYQCLQNNLNLARMAVASGDIGNANRQLKKDLEVAEILGIGNPNAKSKIVIADCNDNNPAANRTATNDCITGFSVAIMRKQEDAAKSQNQGSRNRY